MTQDDSSTNPGRVKIFATGSFIQVQGGFCTFEFPAELDAVKAHFPRPAGQFYRAFVDIESKWCLRPQTYPAGHIAGHKKTGGDTDGNIRRTPQSLNQVEIHPNAELRQLRLQ